MKNVVDKLDWSPRARAYNNIARHCRADIMGMVWKYNVLPVVGWICRDAVRDELRDWSSLDD